MTEYREQRVLFDDNKAQFIVTVEVPTLRDQFAMAALPGLIARIGRPNTMMRSMTDVAKVAYELADTLLAVRK